MNHESVLKEIKSGKIYPLYLFYGEERLHLEDTLKRVIKMLVDPSSEDFNVNTFDAEKVSASEILDLARTLPFMADRRVIIVKGIDSPKQLLTDNSDLLSYLESPYKESCLIFIAYKADNRKKFFIRFKKKGKIINCPRLKIEESTRWIINKVRSSGFQIDSMVAEHLADSCNSNLKRIESELEKIFIYIGKTKSIDYKTVNLLVGNPKVESVFKLTGAIGKGNINDALSKMENVLHHGTQPPQALGAIAWQFRAIWKAKALLNKKASKSEISAGVGNWKNIDEYIEQAKNFSQQYLIYAFERMLQADIDLKSAARPRLSMESLIIDLCLKSQK